MRTRLQQMNEDLLNKQQPLTLTEIDQWKSQVERFRQDLRTIQSESSLLDRLMEESNTTINDSTTHRAIFFTVESRSIQNLLDMIENKVRSSHCPRSSDQLIDVLARSTSNSNRRIESISR